MRELAPSAIKSVMMDAWDESLLVNPHEVSDKRRRVQRMFAAIAPSYDLNNRLHSFWMDQSWRRKAVRSAQLQPDDRVVDVACGTGDLTLAFFDGLRHTARWNQRCPAGEVSESISHTKCCRSRSTSGHKHASQKKVAPTGVCFVNGDAQSLPLPNGCCDVAIDRLRHPQCRRSICGREGIFRILRPGGRVVILEFSIPTNPLFRALYNFYFKQILPRTATWISGDKTGAYKYLPQSVRTFIGRETMVEMLAKAGFGNISQYPMTIGICICYRGFKA